MPNERKSRRTVNLCHHTKAARGFGKTGRVKLWAFGIADLAMLFGMTEGTVRTALHRNAFDPIDLESLCEFWRRRTRKRGKSKPRPPAVLGEGSNTSPKLLSSGTV